MTVLGKRFGPDLDIFTMSIGECSTTAAEWSQLANTTYMEAGRLDSNDRRFISAPFCSNLVFDVDGNRILILYNQLDEVLQIMSVFAFCRSVRRPFVHPAL